MQTVQLLAASLLLAAASAAEPDTAVADALRENGVDVDKYPGLKDKSKESCVQLCAVLASVIPNHTIVKGPQYDAWREAFWSKQQSATQPACIFQPADAKQVSIGLLLARFAGCLFAVKSGGHAAFSGSSSIQSGLNIDLSLLSSVTLSSDKKIVKVGAGNRWIDVYKALEPHGLAAIGGRVSDIGVGGFTLGGGISYFSGEYGWACDNVENYEVVTADGRILNVGRETYPDLYWALRGGGNNFGFVTRFDVTTHSQGPMWSSSRLYTFDHRDEFLKALTEFGHQASDDPDAALFLALGYNNGTFWGQVQMEYAKPVENPAIFKKFIAIPAVTSVAGIRTLSNITLELKKFNPNGFRESWWTATYKLDYALLNYILDVYLKELEPIKNAAGILPVVIFQIITPRTITRMQQNGGNALGLSPSDGPLLLLNLSFRWQNTVDDDAIRKVLDRIIAESDARAKTSGLYHEYLYMNYASQYQKVVPSYGTENHERLVEIAKKYDPQEVFQKLQPGYFKLNGAPNAGSL
ncbi:hypothetical protein PRK78_002034 [Emydomyces testavorans]|uniref:FAD-binding PCMH-type domain-containing protein n=1 Tax=Emydomyces testavorans TaxID=2070801 RepID=A0AAF0DFL4_9EURO|nr:hypothetical protein PRK78_002034 [Emydomyces testavorans]